MTRSFVPALALLLASLAPTFARVTVPASAPGGPPDVLVSDDGRLVVTFDQGPQVGGDDAIVLFLDGRRVARLAPEAFLTEDELLRMWRCKCLIGHRHWRHLVEASIVANDLVLLRTDGSGAAVIDGETGEVSQVAFGGCLLTPPGPSS